MGVVQNIIGMVHGLKDRARQVNIDRAMKNYMNDPDAAIAAVNDISGSAGVQLAQQRRTEEAARAKAAQEQQDRSLGLMRNYMRGLPEGADTNAAFDQLAPFMEQLGVPENMFAGFRSAVAANPNALLDDDSFKDMMKDRFSGTVVTPGSIYMRGGKEVTRAPYAMRAETTPAGASTNVFDPNAGRFVTGPSEDAGGGANASPAPVAAAPSKLGGAGLHPRRATGEQVQAFALKLAPGAVMTSGVRSPEKNRSVGGQPDSYHLPSRGGVARDFVPGPGQTMAQLHASLKRGFGAGWDVINEGDHVHIEPGPGGGALRSAALGAPAPAQAAPSVTPYGVAVPPKPAAPAAPRTTYRAATPDELKAAGYPDGTAAQIDSDGKLVNLKTPPAAAQKASRYDYERAGQSLSNTYTLLREAQEVMNMPGLAAATGNIQGRIPGLFISGQAQDARNALEALRNNVGLNQLLQAKAMSSQGASGFGNLSNAEGDRLEKAFGSLDTTTSDAELRSNLNVAVTTLNRVAERISWQMERSETGLDWKVPPEGTVRNGHRFLGGSPANPQNWQKVKGK
jgi:hypothetical protein